jgi:hypothetical protein
VTVPPICEYCGKVAFDVTELRVEELIPGASHEMFVLRFPECDYHRTEEAYESTTAEARFEAMQCAVDFFGSVEP